MSKSEPMPKKKSREDQLEDALRELYDAYAEFITEGLDRGLPIPTIESRLQKAVDRAYDLVVSEGYEDE